MSMLKCEARPEVRKLPRAVRDFVVFCEDDDGKRLMGEEKSRFSGIGAPHFDALCARPHPLETLLHQGDFDQSLH
jgi:hypothetical protein